MIGYFPTDGEVARCQKIGKLYYDTDMLPSWINPNYEPKKKMALALLTMLKGLELGISPQMALSQISMISNNFVISGQLMLSLIYQFIQQHPEAQVIFVKIDEEGTIIKAKRSANDPYQTFSFMRKDMERIRSLVGKSSAWIHYPKIMMKWRAVSDMARTMFADVITGVYLHDELEANTLEMKELKNDLLIENPKVMNHQLLESNPITEASNQRIQKKAILKKSIQQVKKTIPQAKKTLKQEKKVNKTIGKKKSFGFKPPSISGMFKD